MYSTKWPIIIFYCTHNTITALNFLPFISSTILSGKLENDSNILSLISVGIVSTLDTSIKIIILLLSKYFFNFL